MKKVEFYSYLKDDYVNTALIIEYNEVTNRIDSATLHSNNYGVITVENNKAKVHIWKMKIMYANYRTCQKGTHLFF